VHSCPSVKLTSIPVSRYSFCVPQDRATATRSKLIQTASEAIRRKGLIATRIDDVCAASGVTKGAFFHHFKTKEDMAEACLIEWSRGMAEMLEKAPFQKEISASKRVSRCIDFFIQLFDNPETVKSCLVGTTVQEISETHPQLRMAANECFEHAKGLFKAMLDEACQTGKKRVDTASLADLWIATLQGSLILYKASQNPSVIRKNLQHMKQYIAGYLPE
jgi:TetR/AcrR family transcriptional regulator, transcriptional repressor for nem operon